MSSNEHPDMSGNPFDLPILCFLCGEACRENDLYGILSDESLNFCSNECALKFDSQPDKKSKPKKEEPSIHQLFETGDPDAPKSILDSNGEVALGLCKICGKGEIELKEPCVPIESKDSYLLKEGKAVKIIRNFAKVYRDSSYSFSEISDAFVFISGSKEPERFESLVALCGPLMGPLEWCTWEALHRKCCRLAKQLDKNPVKIDLTELEGPCYGETREGRQMQRKLMEGEIEKLKQSRRGISDVLFPMYGDHGEYWAGVIFSLDDHIKHGTTDGKPWVEPSLTDEDMAKRIWVMCRDRDTEPWTGPRESAAKSSEFYYVFNSKGDILAHWIQCRRATPEEIKAAGLEMKE
jgi:hypothetical protein